MPSDHLHGAGSNKGPLRHLASARDSAAALHMSLSSRRAAVTRASPCIWPCNRPQPGRCALQGCRCVSCLPCVPRSPVTPLQWKCCTRRPEPLGPSPTSCWAAGRHRLEVGMDVNYFSPALLLTPCCGALQTARCLGAAVHRRRTHPSRAGVRKTPAGAQSHATREPCQTAVWGAARRELVNPLYSIEQIAERIVLIAASR